MEKEGRIKERGTILTRGVTRTTDDEGQEGIDSHEVLSFILISGIRQNYSGKLSKPYLHFTESRSVNQGTCKKRREDKVSGFEM